MSPSPFSRRTFMALSGTGLASLATAGCAPGATRTPAAGDGSSVRVVWWGNDKRTELTQEALDSFSASHPGAAIAPEPTEWGGYWDRLATQVAAQDAPDLIQMDEKYLLEYARRGALADLAAVDTTAFAPGTVELGEADGTLYAINAGTIAPVLMANPELFDQAGVPLPDDATWTWDDLKRLAITLTTNLPAGSYGLTDFSGRDAAFRVWVRQNGVETFTDGQLGFGPEVAASFFAMAKDLMDSGATPPASQSTEDVSAPVAQRLFSTGLTAMAIYSSNQITAFDAATGKDLRLLRLPSRDGTPAGARLAYQASMYWCVMSQAKNPERAVQLASYLVNDEAAGRILLTERGVPANTQVLAAIQNDLSASDKKAIAYLDSLEPHLAPTPPLTPQGASSFEDVLIRHGQDVLFGRATPQAAGESFVNEMRTAIG